MPNRVIWEKRLTSRNFNLLSDGAEVCFTRILSRVDDHGRCEVDPQVLKGLCYPLKDKLKPKKIASHLAELVSTLMICLWIEDGRLYGVFRKWEENNPHYCVTLEGKPTRHRAKCPAPPEDLDGATPEAIQYISTVYCIDFAKFCQVLPELLYPYPYPKPKPGKKKASTSEENQKDYEKRVDEYYDNLDPGYISDLKKAHPKKNIQEELAQAKVWLKSNPHKKQLKRFTTNWMGRNFKPFTTKKQKRMEGVTEKQIKIRASSLHVICSWLTMDRVTEIIVETIGKYGISMVDRTLKKLSYQDKPTLKDYWNFVKQ